MDPSERLSRHEHGPPPQRHDHGPPRWSVVALVAPWGGRGIDLWCGEPLWPSRDRPPPTLARARKLAALSGSIFGFRRPALHFVLRLPASVCCRVLVSPDSERLMGVRSGNADTACSRRSSGPPSVRMAAHCTRVAGPLQSDFGKSRLATCRLPPAACRLPPAACRLPPAASPTPSTMASTSRTALARSSCGVTSCCAWTGGSRSRGQARWLASGHVRELR
ncbi:MAG: hypothetical protein ACI9MC_000814 [Kiritimatiellia bacterium]|jgi:hypothetical protein